MPGWTRSSEWRIGHWVNDLGLLRLQSSVRDFHHASRPRSSLEKKRLQHKTAFVVFWHPFFPNLEREGWQQAKIRWLAPKRRCAELSASVLTEPLQKSAAAAGVLPLPRRHV